MEREQDSTDVVELGAASAETQGMAGPTTDQQIGFRVGGISDE